MTFERASLSLGRMDDDAPDPLDAPTPANLSRRLLDAIDRVCTAPWGTFLAEPDGQCVAIAELWADGGVNTETALTVPSALVLLARFGAWRNNSADVGDVARAIEDARWAAVVAGRKVAA